MRGYVPGLLTEKIMVRCGTDRKPVLGQFDLVFAQGRCALEALAVGAAVVLCDATGAGPLVTARELDRLRSRVAS